MTNTGGHANGALRGVVAVGASAGGVEALTDLPSGLPADLPYAVLVVMHMPPGAPSVLAQIIDRAGPLPAVSATDGAERAMSILGKRLSEATSGAGTLRGT